MAQNYTPTMSDTTPTISDFGGAEPKHPNQLWCTTGVYVDDTLSEDEAEALREEIHDFIYQSLSEGIGMSTAQGIEYDVLFDGPPHGYDEYPVYIDFIPERFHGDINSFTVVFGMRGGITSDSIEAIRTALNVALIEDSSNQPYSSAECRRINVHSNPEGIIETHKEMKAEFDLD